MREQEIKIEFHSCLGELMSKFIREKRACGYNYDIGNHALRRLDRFLCSIGLRTMELPRSVVECWIAKRMNEQPGTQKLRIIFVRQFAIYLHQQGIRAYIPEATRISRNHLDFTPYIFRLEEVRSILSAVDHLPPDNRSPKRHLIMPEVFRLLYCCGMRLSEVLHLKVVDVDLAVGILTVREGKFNKDRLVPLHPSMTMRLKKYAALMGECEPNAIFFPAPDGGPYSNITVYSIFRRLLRECGIPHGGRGKGPRLHDLRHSFAVHNLGSWYRQGANLGAKLPVLAAYMGHRSLVGTQRYLQLTPEIFPDINARIEKFVGHIIPGGQRHEAD